MTEIDCWHRLYGDPYGILIDDIPHYANILIKLEQRLRNSESV